MARGSRCWILVIADDGPTRTSVTDTLNIAGYPTIGVATAPDAKEWLTGTEGDPSLIFVEGEQNVLDSVRVRELQQPTPHHRPIPIVVLSGPHDRPVQDMDGSVTNMEFLPKPVDRARVEQVAIAHCPQ